jgi:hypothetical protein
VPFAAINLITGEITISVSAPLASTVVSVFAKDSTGFEYYQNYTLVGTLNNLPGYLTPLPNIVMTSGNIVIQDISGFINPDADGDLVSIFSVIPSPTLPMSGSTLLSFTPTSLAKCGLHTIEVVLTDGIVKVPF